MSAILYVCPRCFRDGFSDLKRHNCRGVDGTYYRGQTLKDERRRLTPKELRAARAYTVRVGVSAPSVPSVVKPSGQGGAS